jgi:serine/threonine protein kinase/Flp pilus assembly protein TadD
MKTEDIFLAAVEKDSPAERAAYLDGACGNDAGLRARVEALLTAHDGAGSFLEQPLLDPAVTWEAPRVGERPGTVLGPYKLLEQIGVGGFGVVFMAEQTQPVRRKVALKVLKPGMDTRQVVARFEAERQALALMDHPNIAHVFDGGETASGRPYFVMELARGIPINDFCDQSHLTIRQRLELFVNVCQAVQHAHQKGIIHRDIKPSNVLVTLHDDRAVVKVIDFGIAKATGQQLTDKTLFTNFAQLIGTPMYMSPEQAQMSGLDIDTRTDIYSLGVLLYELLTGTTPFDQERLRKAAYDEVRRIIREEEPVPPSTRISTLGQVASAVSVNRSSDPKRLKQLCRGELDWIVMKCLEKDRNRRYETANGLGREVERYLHDEPVLACPPSAGYRLRKFARRHRAALFTAALLVATLLLGSGISIWQAIAATLARNAETEARRDLEAAKDRAEKAQQLADDRAAQIAADLKRLNAANALVESGRFHADFWEFAEAEVDFTKALGCAPKSSSVWAERGQFYLRLGLWDLAAADAAKAFQRQEPDSVHSWLFHALLRFQVGDTGGHSQICKRMANRFGGSTDPVCCETVARACLLGADPVIDRAKLAQLAERVGASGREAWRLNTLGLAYYRADQYEQAVLRTAEAQALHPNWNKPGNYAIGAMAHHRLGQADQARKKLDAAAVAQEERIRALFKNGPGFMPCAWWDFLASSLHYREAKKLIEGKEPPDDARLWVVRGRALAALARHEQARVSFAQAIELNPALASAWTSRGDTYVRLGQWDKAIADYARASELAPRDAVVHNHRAWLLATCPDAAFRDPQAAVALARKCVVLSPREARYWTTLGMAQYRVEDWPAAIAALLKSVDLSQGGSAENCLFLAMAQWRLDKKETARRWFALGQQRAANSNLANEDALCRFRAEAAALLGLSATTPPVPSKAPLDQLAIFTLVLETDPGATWAYDRRGHTLGQQQQWQQAAADFAEAAKGQPDNPYHWCHCAKAKLGAGDLDGYGHACASLRQRFGKSNDPVAASLLVSTFTVTDQGAPADHLARWGRLAVRRGPYCHRLVGYALYRAGQYEAAIAAIRNAGKDYPLRGGDHLILAMAEHHLGHKDEADTAFAQAVQWIGEWQRVVAAGGYWHWTEQIDVRQLHREAEQLLGLQHKKD